MMADWAAFCDGKRAADGVVVPMSRAIARRTTF